MEVRYKREVNHNYMILDAPSEGGGYECRMLASNTIEGLLRFRVRQYEDKREFYYEITSRQPLNRLLEQRKINGGEIRSILLSLSRVLSKIEPTHPISEISASSPISTMVSPRSPTAFWR